jgi:hypothetical protein
MAYLESYSFEGRERDIYCKYLFIKVCCQMHMCHSMIKHIVKGR